MATKIQFQKAQDILKGFSVPPQPSIITAVRKVAPDTSKMASVVEQDPALSGSILKVVNSPAIGAKTKITSVVLAINMLGVDSVMNIINAIMLKKALSSNKNEAVLEQFWQSSKNVAVAMAAMVRQLNLSKSAVTPDEAYCLGLFHHCAMPVILQKHEDYFSFLKDLSPNPSGNLTQQETEKYQTNHAVLGYFITKSWHLPKALCEAVKLHHRREVLSNLEKQDEKTALLLALLKLSEHIATEYNNYQTEQSELVLENLHAEMVGFVGISELDYQDLEDVIHDTIDRENSAI